MVKIYFYDQREHHRPHLHAEYNGEEAIYAIPDGDLIAGAPPRRQARLVEGWIALRQTELDDAWERAARGEAPGQIAPLA